MAPATTLTVIVVGDAVTTPLFRVKLMVLPIVPDVGVTVKAPGGTPAVVTVAVKVPEPEVVLVPVCPHSKACDVGVTVKEDATGGGSASPAGPSAPITCEVSTTRFCASVTISWLLPQPFCVARKLPPLVVTTDGETVRNCVSGDTTTYGGVPP